VAPAHPQTLKNNVSRSRCPAPALTLPYPKESPSEDPLTLSLYGTAHTIGLQNGEDPRYVKTVVTMKHSNVYQLEDSGGFTRYNFNAEASNYILADAYLPPFRASIVDGGALGVMCRCVCRQAAWLAWVSGCIAARDG
jgi:hypothetical protein